MTPTESELLIKINSAPAGLNWEHYRALLARNRDGTITPAERASMITMIYAVEKANAERIKNLIALAQLRGLSLDSLLKSLDIVAPPVEEGEMSYSREDIYFDHD